MKLTRLSIANIRSIGALDIEFAPKTTVLVGINGIGKSTIIDVLAVMLSQALPDIGESKETQRLFTWDDFRQEGGGWLTCQLTLDLDGRSCDYTVRQSKAGGEKDQNLSAFGTLPSRSKRGENQPLAVYYGVSRSRSSSAGERARLRQRSSPFSQALEPRPLRIQELADWWVGIHRPDRSRGMDTNWILRHLMEDDDRPVESRQAIDGVERLVADGSYSEARRLIAKYRDAGLDLPEWATIDARMARMEALAK